MSCRAARSGPALPPFSFPAILPTHGWWDDDAKITCCVAAYQAIGADSYADSLVNLANPGTYDLTAGANGDPTWNAIDGWNIANSKYLKTGFKPSENGSYILRYSEGANDNFDCAFGAYDTILGNYGVFLTPRWFASRLWSNAESKTLAGYSTSGRMALAALRCYWNGAHVTTIALQDGTFPLAYDLYVGGSNYNNAANLIFTGKIQGLAIYSCTLTDAEIAQVDAELAAL